MARGRGPTRGRVCRVGTGGAAAVSSILPNVGVGAVAVVRTDSDDAVSGILPDIGVGVVAVVWIGSDDAPAGAGVAASQ